MTIETRPYHLTREQLRGINLIQGIVLHEVNEGAAFLDGRMQTPLPFTDIAHQSYHYAVDANAIRAYVPIAKATFAIGDLDTMSPWTVALANPGIDPDLYTVNVAVLIGTANLPNPCLPGCGREYPPTLLTNLQELLAYIAEEAGLDLETPNIVWKHGTELCDLDLEPLLLPIEELDPGQSDWLCDRLADLPVGQSDPTAVVGTDCVAYTPAQVVEAGLCEVLEALDAGVGVPTALVGADCETYTPAQVVTVGLCDALEALEAGESEAPMLVGSDCGLYPMPVFVPEFPNGILATDINSDAATIGQVLTADGNGGAAWETFPFSTELGVILAAQKNGLYVTYTSATTIAISAGSAVMNGVVYTFAAGSATFADIDAGAEAVGTNYYVYALAAGGYKISVSASAPTGYTTANSKLIGWFHNNPSNDISQYSVASGTDVDYPERGPKPGMVMLPGAKWMIDIYIASDLGGTGKAVHAGNAAASAYNATPWASLTAAGQMKACHNAGKRLCTNEEWSMAALGTPAGDDANTTCWTKADNAASNPTGTLTGCVSTLGCYDMTGNVWERVSTWYDNTDVAADQAGWDWATAWTNEAEGGGAYTPFGNTAGQDALTGPRQWLRGGDWGDSTYAGGWAALGDASPRHARSSIGFRCCA